jgi:RNA polymerase sigma-70 factor (ECF subfamily)
VNRLDDRILEKLARHPEKGLELLMNRYMGLVYTIVSDKLTSVCDKEDIEECVSEIFFELYQARDTIDTQKSSLKSFVALVAKRKAINRYYKIMSRRQRLANLEGGGFAGMDEASESPADQVAGKETREALIQSIQALGEPDCEIMVRKYYLGQSSKDIAATLRLKVNTVDKKVSRGLAKLKSLLEGVL